MAPGILELIIIAAILFLLVGVPLVIVLVVVLVLANRSKTTPVDEARSLNSKKSE